MFKSTVFDFGAVKAGQKVNFKFEFNDDINLPVEWIKWGCSCTVGTEVVDGKYIAGELDITKAGVLGGTNKIVKSIIVKLKDGLCEFEVNPASPVRAARVNSKCLRAILTLQGTRSDIESGS